VLDGGDNPDWLWGGSGADFLYGNAGRDHLNGQGGDDDLNNRGDTGPLVGGPGNDDFLPTGITGTDQSSDDAGDNELNVTWPPPLS
jgi:Ca2+-binding RTX toxin-like protein